MIKTNGKPLSKSDCIFQQVSAGAQRSRTVKQKRSIRGTRGTGVTEACAFLVLFSILFVCGIVFFLNCAEVGYFKYKLGCVSDRTAEYMAASVYFAGAENPNFAGSNLHSKATILVNRLLKDSGLPNASLVETSVKGRLLAVKITVPDLPLFQGATLMPTKITISDVAVVPIPVSQPPAVMSLTYGGQRVFLPVYGSSTAVGPAKFYSWGGGYFQSSFQLPAGSGYTATP